MISDLPQGWRWTTIAELAAPKKHACVGGPFGSNLTGKDYVPAPGVPVIRGQNMGDANLRFVDEDFVFVSEQKAATLVQNMAYPGDLVFTQRGTLGQVAWIPPSARFPRYVISQSQMKLTVDESRADPGFIYAYFRSAHALERISRNAIATGVPHINLGILRAFPVPLPPLDEQRSIAAILGALDDKIELNRRMNQTLEEMGEALFRSWFIDFDGHADLVDSAVGLMPRGWQVGSLGDLAVITMGQSPPGSTYNEHGDGLPFFQGATDFGSVFPTNRVYCNAPTRLAHEWDVLVSVRAPVGRANLALERCAIGRGVASIRSQSGMHPAYVWGLVHSLSESLDVYNGEGTVFGSINKKALHALPVAIPPHANIVAFDALARPLLSRLRLADAESRTLTNLRDTLLPKLISGELRVPDAEAAVSEAL